ncbi:MAG: hypothetical protein ACI9HK_005255, partial [Pirellulaceae bacterium]
MTLLLQWRLQSRQATMSARRVIVVRKTQVHFSAATLLLLATSVFVATVFTGTVFTGTLFTATLFADEKLDLDGVQSIIRTKCLSCHGAEKREGGLRLDSLAAATTGGDTAAAIVPGNPEKSLLVKAIRFDDPDLQMPPKDRLTDAQIATLTHWVKSGANWPRPVHVLFDEQEEFLATLSKGKAIARFESRDVYRGKLAVAVTPQEKFAEQIVDWKFPIREHPGVGEYRYLRYAWKKTGGGGAMFEVAREGKWPPANATPAPGGRYVAGPNETGMDAIVVSLQAPATWKEVTLDLWKDLGDCHVTGLSLMASGSGETLFDTFLLSASRADLDAWSPGRGTFAFAPTVVEDPIGTAMEEPRNPIRQLFAGERLDLWSLQSPVDPQTEGSVDSFIHKRLKEAGLQPSPTADRRTLIRRLSFDLTGLPPTPAEVAAFLEDESPQAYEKVVERLLGSTSYGERQARLWLDVVRYADTNGYERDEFRPLAWQYRDYVVSSFNQDKPFKDFIREQLAGDEIVDGYPKNQQEADALVATGYLRLGQWDSTAAIFQEEERLRAEMMADVTNTTAAAFLGVTMSCCQCHDHKYDPLSQADHYRLRAFFAATKPRDDLVIDLPAERDAAAKHNSELDRNIEAANLELAKLVGAEKAVADKAVAEKDKPRHAELSQQIAELESKRRKPRVAMGAADSGPTAPATHVFYQGDFNSPRDKVAPGYVSVLYPGAARIERPRDNTTGRRLALANWIASPNNPWTARVIANRIWQQHFGTGIVATPNDFGYSGSPPTHPQLLDWLASSLVKNDWSIKRLHRLVVMSATYRQRSAEGLLTEASGGRTTNPQSDPDNSLLWRQNVRRLDAESLRDSLLSVSGSLRPFPGGKPLWPAVPDELLRAQPAILEALEGKDGGRQQGWYTDKVEQTDVRSLYLVRKRCLPIPMLQSFDLPETIVSCARRNTTVVAPQALMLLNSPAAIRFAQTFADRIAKQVGSCDVDEPEVCSEIVKSGFQLA